MLNNTDSWDHRAKDVLEGGQRRGRRGEEPQLLPHCQLREGERDRGSEGEGWTEKEGEERKGERESEKERGMDRERRGEEREGDRGRAGQRRRGEGGWLAALLSLSHQIRRSSEREMSLCSKTSLLPPQTVAAGAAAQ